MVLAERVGKKRGFWRGLLLTVVTFGIYAVYWNYKAHNEVYRQFELQREGRSDGMVWYVLGLVVPPFLLAYIWTFGENVDYLRRRIGLPRGQGPGRFLALVGVGAAIFVAGLIYLNVALAGMTEDMPDDEASRMLWDALPLYAVLTLAAFVFFGVAWAGLQRDINGLYDAYATRMQWLASHPESPYATAPVASPVAAYAPYPAPAAPYGGAYGAYGAYGAPPSPYAPQPAYAPPQAQHPAAAPPSAYPSQHQAPSPYAHPAYGHPTYAQPSPYAASPYGAAPAAVDDERTALVRGQVQRLRDEHPDLLALERLDALLARAQAGDPAGVDEAEALVRDVAQLLEERRGLLAGLGGASEEERPAMDERLSALEMALFRAP